MDLASLTASLSRICDHLQLFLCLLFGLPFAGFLGIRYWVAAHSAKTQRSTHWFVPIDFHSEAARVHYRLPHNSAAFAHRVYHPSHHSVAVRGPRMRPRP